MVKTRGHIKGLMRSNRLRGLRKIRSARHNLAEIHYISSSAHAYKVLFILSTGLLFIAFLLSEHFLMAASKSVVPTLILAAPLTFFEVCWLQKREIAMKLVKEHGKLLRYQRIKCFGRN